MIRLHFIVLFGLWLLMGQGIAATHTFAPTALFTPESRQCYSTFCDPQVASSALFSPSIAVIGMGDRGFNAHEQGGPNPTYLGGGFAFGTHSRFELGLYYGKSLQRDHRIDDGGFMLRWSLNF